MQFDVYSYCIFSDSSVRQAIECIDRTGQGIALVTDTDYRLIGTVTDGDIRRAILGGICLDSPITKGLPSQKPITALIGTEPAKLLQLMQKHVVRQIPLLDPAGRVVGLITLDELAPETILPVQAMIMAGGFGKRLRPLTEDLPKPMLPIGDKPVMEWIVNQIRKAGILQINVATHYKSEQIKEYFGDGSNFGIQISYIDEAQPLGTGGALSLLAPPQEPLLVINGDILTQVDFRAMVSYHREHKAEMTIAVRRFEMQVPYGVIESTGAKVHALREKPNVPFLVNAGIYLIEPSVFKFISYGHHFNITDLVKLLVDDGRNVVNFPIREYWLDIGQYAEYMQAQTDVKEGRLNAATV